MIAGTADEVRAGDGTIGDGKYRQIIPEKKHRLTLVRQGATFWVHPEHARPPQDLANRPPSSASGLEQVTDNRQGVET
jgi:hypothetical protein